MAEGPKEAVKSYQVQCIQTQEILLKHNSAPINMILRTYDSKSYHRENFFVPWFSRTESQIFLSEVTDFFSSSGILVYHHKLAAVKIRDC